MFEPFVRLTRTLFRALGRLQLVSLLVLVGAACASVPKERSPNADEREWIQLFNGEDLNDWQIKFTGYDLGHNFNNTFRVEDGLLRVVFDEWDRFDGEFGHIFHNTPFSHYIVAVEHRFVGEQPPGGPGWARRNNGIMIHSQSAGSMGRDQDFPISIEVQLLGGLGEAERSTANLCTPGTRVVMDGQLRTEHCINSRSQTYHGDQWVRVEALVLGDSVVKHIVNGDTVMTYTQPQQAGGARPNAQPGVYEEGRLLSGGYITLQAESAPTDFRKVEVLNLEGCSDPQASNYKSYYVKSNLASCAYGMSR